MAQDDASFGGGLLTDVRTENGVDCIIEVD
jgi:hypothetical protein